MSKAPLSSFSRAGAVALWVGIGTLGQVACGSDRVSAIETVQSVEQELAATNYFGTGLGDKQLILTFDDGPGTRTAELSTYLKTQNIRATFFINGACVQATALPNPGCGAPTPNAAAILSQVAADGHLLANHTTTHRSLTGENGTLVPAGQRVTELSETDGYIAPYVPWNHFFFRPPYGDWNTTVYNALRVTAMNKYIGPIYWDIGGFSDQYPNAAADWACWQGDLDNASGGPANGTGFATTTQCGNAYRNEIAAMNHGIVLMHDPFGNTVDMVKYIVPLLKADGYKFEKALYDVPTIAAAVLSCNAACATCSGPNATDCTSCTGGKYLSGGTCATCSTCATGTYVATACAAATNTVCSACNASCTACTGPAATQCSACTTGYYLNGTTCTACTACSAGSRQTSACSASANTVCASCAAGTFSSAAGATTCTACAVGTFSAAGATACTACGSCDDANLCTTDTCSAASGCTHAAIAGCVPPVPSDPDASTDAATGEGESSDASRPDDPPSPEDSTPNADSGTPNADSGTPSDGEGDKGCSASGTRATSFAFPASLAFVALALRRRRRSTH